MASEKLPIRGGGLEEATLRAVIRQNGSGYAVTLHTDIEVALDEKLTPGPIYVALDRLEKKGFITSRWSEATNKRGGRRKQYFEITDAGRAAVIQIEVAQERMRRVLPIGA